MIKKSSRKTWQTLGVGLVALMVFLSSTASVSAQTASPPPVLDPVIGCSLSLEQSVVSACQAQAQAVQWVVPGVAAQRQVIPAGLPRAGDGSLAESADAR
jgi:hypothetical protein